MENRRHNPNIWLGAGAAAIVAAGALALSAYGGQHHQPSPQPTQVIHGETNLLGGQWHYLPGAQVEGDGLHIAHRGFAIVEQDGSGGQPNPPVNEYGTHLNVAGNFVVAATLTHIDGRATWQIYGSPPKVSDEFRVETPSVRLTKNDGQLTVQIWNGQATRNLADQQPVEAKTFPIADTNRAQLELDEQNGQLIIEANGKKLGQLADDEIFSSHQAWFGFDAENSGGNFIVSKLTAKPLNNGKLATLNTSAEPAVAKNPNGLQQLANKKRPGFLIGGDAALWAATSNDSYNKLLFGGNLGIITPENAMKWQFIEPQPDVYDFHEADALVNLALKNGLQVHGHNLVFSEALPKWTQDLPTNTPEQKAYVKQVLYNHVYTLVHHFKGRVNEWDLNEIFADYNDDGNLPNDGFNNNVFYRTLGENYIKVACQAAIAADPKVKLWVNDFGAETDTDQRWQFMFNTIKKWKTDWKLPIYGFGFESHIYNPTTDDIANSIDDNGKPTLENHINTFAGIGLKSRISEMDAPASDPGYAEDDSSQAAEFSGTLKICLDDPNCVAFSMWSLGLTDMSQSGAHALESGEIDSPFGQTNQPVQPTYRDLQNVLHLH